MLLILLLLCGQAWVQVATQKTPCCVARKFNGQMMRIQAFLQAGSSTPILTDLNSHIDYDADLQQERIQGVILDPTTGVRSNYTEYKDFKHAKKYVVTDKGCTESQLQELMIPPCLAQKFTVERQYSVSGQAVTVWEGSYLGTLWANIHFVDSTCAPLAVHIYGSTPDGSYILYSYQFGDVQLDQLTEANPFQRPASCNQLFSEIYLSVYH